MGIPEQEGREKGIKEILGVIKAKTFLKPWQTPNHRSNKLRECQAEKIPKILSAYHIQAAQNQRQSKNLEGRNREKLPYP